MSGEGELKEKNADVGGSAAMEKMPLSMSLNDRDPKGLQNALKEVLVFSDIIGEPEPGTYSFDRIWIWSYQAFTSSKLWCYRILTLLFAIPAAVCWGLSFACLSFCHIWCCVPCIKSCNIKMLCLQKVYAAIMGAFIAPLFDAIGRCLSHIRVTSIKGPDEEHHVSHHGGGKFEIIHMA